MDASRISQRALCAALAVLALTLYADAHEYILDDFEDGNVEDGDPVTWIPGTPAFGWGYKGGHRELVDGNWVWTPTDNNDHMAATVDEYTYEDVSVHAQFRISPTPGAANLKAGDGQCSALMKSNGTVSIWAGSDYLIRNVGTGVNPVANDVHMQFDLLNNEDGVDLSVTAWHDGDPRPAIPQAMANWDATCTGRVGLFVNYWNSDPGPTVEYRFFEAKPLRGTAVSEAELITSGQDWSFVPGTMEPSPFPELAWTTPEFDDSQWATHQEGFGYGPDINARGVVTVLDEMQDNYNTVYLRRPFQVEDPLAFSDLLLEIDFNDAFVAYINGSEVAGYNVARRPGSPQAFDARGRVRSVEGVSTFLIELADFPRLLRSGDDNILAIQGINYRSSDEDFALSQIRLSALTRPLQAGDADQDYDFDQLDLVQVLAAAKYLTGEPATWGEGDWNGAPGGYAGNPPEGNGVFDQIDIIAAVGTDLYMTGPQAAVQPDGRPADAQASIVYNAATSDLAVDAPVGTELTSMNIDSASGIFTGQPAANLGGSFDNDSDTNVFKATFGSSFGSLSFGNVAQPGLDEEFLLGDLTIIGSLEGGGGLGDVDLVYVPIPEPSALVLLILGILGVVAGSRGPWVGLG